MSKERLEEHTHIAVKKDEYKKIKERVQELEKYAEKQQYNMNLTNKTLLELEQQNKRYREALEFYENPYNWQDGLVSIDAGDKARQALEGDLE